MHILSACNFPEFMGVFLYNYCSCCLPNYQNSVVFFFRRTKNWGCESAHTNPQAQSIQQPAHTIPLPRQIHDVQLLWDTHVSRIISCGDVNMWRLFCAVRKQTRVCQSAVLRAVRPALSPACLPRWPVDRRQLDRFISKAGGFHSRVLRKVLIDMTDQKTDSLEFTFVDPLYAWAHIADTLSRTVPLHFQYAPVYSPGTRQQLYGSSVKCGEVMRKSCERVARYVSCLHACMRSV